MGLVTIILVMFLSNIRTALVVAINIPLALLFAFSVLFRAANRPTCCPWCSRFRQTRSWCSCHDVFGMNP
jgi:hypothetical protein